MDLLMRKMTKQKVELRNAFIFAKTSDEMLKVFTKMESCFEDDELGLECLALTNQLLKDGFLEKVLLYGKKALKILLKNPTFDFDHSCQEHVSSASIVFALYMLGSACLGLKLFDESLNYLNWASKNLSKIELDANSLCRGQCILEGYLEDVEGLLVRVNVGLGKMDETVVHLRKLMGIKERVMEEGCIVLGHSNRDIYKVYVLLKSFEEALPFCLKALEIYEKHFGVGSVEACETMSDLEDIYYGLGEFEKRVGLSELAMSGLEKMSSYSTDLLDAELMEGDLLIEMGMYEEALAVLKGVVSHTPKDGCERAGAFLLMARAFCDLRKFDDAGEYIKTACRILEKKEHAMFIATAYRDMSRLYVEMYDFEIAISVLKTALKMPEVPLKVLAECATRLFLLVSLTGKEEELITCLEDVMEKLKKDFGPNHSKVGYSCARLGFAYLKLGQEELAVKLMANAKDIMDFSLGRQHLDSLITSQMLSVTYGTMNRYHLALQLQEEVVEGLKGYGSSEQEFMDEAVRMLNRLKGKVAESPTRISFQPKDLSSKVLKCCISDDEKVTKLRRKKKF